MKAEPIDVSERDWDVLGELTNGLDLSGRTRLREAVRGIIHRDTKLLMVYSSVNGDYKFPGGGVEPGESFEEALAREIEEECGATLNAIKSHFGKVVTYTKASGEDYDIFKMISYYYCCSVGELFGSLKLDAYESDLDFQPEWVEIDNAIQANQRVLTTDRQPRWTRRETNVLELIQSQL